MTKKNETETAATPHVPTFDKQQLLKSSRYVNRRDLLTAILKDGEQYSHADVETIIDEFMKGKVK